MPAGDSYHSDSHRVTTLELFFDLVFVFTLTQLTALLAADASPEGMLRALLIFAVLWWMYGAYAWLTNAAPPDRTYRRVLLVVGMAGFLVTALTIPRAFSGGGVAFGLGYLVVVVVHAGLYALVHPGPTLRFGSFNLISAGLLIAAGLVAPPGTYLLWVAAIAVQFVTPYLIRVADTELRVRPAHFVERHGLLLIVALGESVVAVGIATEGLPLDLPLVTAVVLGLALATALWWSYFARDEAVAEHAMVAAPAARRTQMAINGYFYPFIPMLLGVVAAAAGIKKSLGHLPEPLSPGAAVLLGGGVAAYLAGEAVFRRTLRIGATRTRWLTVAGALASIGLGVLVAAVAQLVALLAVLAAMLVSDARTGSRTAPHP